MNNKKIFFLIIVFLGSTFFYPQKEYENGLVKVEELPISYSNFNFDQYNDNLDEFFNYFSAIKQYLLFREFKKIVIQANNTYLINDVKLFVLLNAYTFQKEEYSLHIEYDKNYISYELNTKKDMYLYVCNEYIDFRIEEETYFIKDRYRMCLSNYQFISLYSYEKSLFLKDNLYFVEDDKLKPIFNNENIEQMQAIANIYLTEYF